MIPGEFAVFSVSSGKVELGPDAHLLLAADLLPAVFGVVGDGGDLLQLVAAHAVVQNDIGKNLDAVFVEGADGLQIFFLGSVFGADRALLVELAQIVCIINAVAHVLLRGALIGGRQPYLRNTQCGKIARFGGAALPPQTVVRQIPFKILHHSLIGTHHIPSFSSMSSACCTTKSGACQIFGPKKRDFQGIINSLFTKKADIE